MRIAWRAYIRIRRACPPERKLLDLRYCPVCAQELIHRADIDDGQKLRQACPDEHWVHWNNPVPVLAAIVEYQGQVLLARNALWPEGHFALIAGFLEQGESPELGIAREVAEETGLQADQVSLVGVYGFERKNQLIIAYHVRASGEVCLSPELAEYKLVGHADILPWPAGTGPALFDWLVSKGYQPIYKEWGIG
ncbi:NUDIX domain-containing protein [Undibacterium sp. LFS511W]|uniref:NUDIX domain-containing protein n=1 Tax=Undibacterium luofuense TaxID=2828733 RepID=A0A941DSJ3_9BURK|nr:NUDIX domain-containing protein [Undibacterium luofuense]